MAVALLGSFSWTARWPGDLTLRQAERTAGQPVAYLLQAAGSIGELGAWPATCGVSAATMPTTTARKPNTTSALASPTAPCGRGAT